MNTFIRIVPHRLLMSTLRRVRVHCCCWVGPLASFQKL